MAGKPHSSPMPLHEEERQQSTLELVRGIANDTGTLVRKELELARIEIVEAVVARVKAIGAFALWVLLKLAEIRQLRALRRAPVAVI